MAASEGRKPGMSKAKTGANAVITAVAVVAVVIGLNVIGSRVFGRLDLTDDKEYTLSPASKQVVAGLPDRMTIKAYISSGLPAPLNQYGRYIRDLLDEYAAASGGRIAWEAIDPLDGDKEAVQAKQEEMKKYNITNLTLQQFSEAKIEIGSNNFLGIGFQYGGEIESLPQVTSTKGLEYQITGIIKRMTQGKKKIGISTGQGELSSQQGLQLISSVLREYDAVPVPLDKPIPDDITALMVIGPKQAFGEKAKYEIDQFLMKGKSVALFIDGMVIETPRGSMPIPGMEQPKMGRANDVGVRDMLEKYGLIIRDDIILDEQNTVGLIQVNGQMAVANHPVFLGVGGKTEGLARDFAVTDKVQALVLPFASSVELVGALKDGKVPDVKVTAIAKSTPRTSWRQSGFYLFNPTVEPQKSAELGPFALGYAIEGKIPSAFPAGPPGSDPNVSTPESSKALKQAPAGTRLLVMGDSDMLSDEYLQIVQRAPQFGQAYMWNATFFLNAVDWLIKDDGLNALRSKGIDIRPLKLTLDGGTKLWIGFNVVGIPLVLVAFGLVLWQVRKARRRNFKF